MELFLVNKGLDGWESVAAEGEKSHQNATQLKAIHLHGNRLPSVPSAFFTPFTQLVQLDLSANRISDFTSDAFNGLRSLTKLNLANNRVHSHAFCLLQ